jgi:hypothetical protein
MLCVIQTNSRGEQVRSCHGQKSCFRPVSCPHAEKVAREGRQGRVGMHKHMQVGVRICEVEVGYAPMRQTGAGRVRGWLLASGSQTPLTGYKIEAYDEDLTIDDLLGWCYADSQGMFELHFDESAVKDATLLDLEGEPEVKYTS